MKQPYIPKGCDQQGRVPEAAEAATELGADQQDGLEWWEKRISDIALLVVIAFAILAIAL